MVIGQVRAPDLIDPIDLQFPQQIGVNLVLWIGARRFRAGVQSPYTHKPHQTLYSFAIDLKTVVIQRSSRSRREPLKGRFRCNSSSFRIISMSPSLTPASFR